MEHFAGLDVSVNKTSICIVDDAGKIVCEAKVASEPEALLAALKNSADHFKRIGLFAALMTARKTGPWCPVQAASEIVARVANAIAQPS